MFTVNMCRINTVSIFGNPYKNNNNMKANVQEKIYLDEDGLGI